MRACTADVRICHVTSNCHARGALSETLDIYVVMSHAKVSRDPVYHENPSQEYRYEHDQGIETQIQMRSHDHIRAHLEQLLLVQVCPRALIKRTICLNIQALV
jgi:hypothetical protein